MSFGAPDFLPFLLLIPAIGWMCWLDLRRRERQLNALASPKLHQQWELHSNTHRLLRVFFLLCALTLLGLALAQPRWGVKSGTIQRQRLSLVLMLDLSPSMKQKDIVPSRWHRTVQEIQTFLEQLSGDRVALMTFDGESGLQCPFTEDYTAIRELSWHHKPKHPPAPTDQLSAVLQKAQKMLLRQVDQRESRVILVLSDGSDSENNQKLLDAGRSLRKSGIYLFVVGVGSPKRGLGKGKPLDEGGLIRLSRAAGGAYVPVERVGFGLQKVHAALKNLHRIGTARRKKNQQIERFPVFLALGLLFLLGNRLLPP